MTALLGKFKPVVFAESLISKEARSIWALQMTLAILGGALFFGENKSNLMHPESFGS